MDTITELPVREAEVAARFAAPHLGNLLAEAKRYPRSFDRVRVMEGADAILDWALGEAHNLCSRFPELEVVVWTDPVGALHDGEFAPKIR